MKKLVRKSVAVLGTAVVLGASAATSSAHVPDHAAVQAHQPPVVDIVSTGHHFEMPAQVAAGWSTFRFHNQTGATHFAVFEKMPVFEGDQKTYHDSVAEVGPVFQAALDLINAGDPAAGFAEFANLPQWYFDVVFTGGPGLIGPGDVAETTVNLEPGTYAVECYVISADGTFHSVLGMMDGFEVTRENTGASAPRADVELTLSNSGIEVDGVLKPGRRTVAVHFAEQMTHNNGLGHDVHLARLDGTDVGELSTWMNWITGLDSPAPVTFLGGAEEMPAGSTAYVSVEVRPGDHAWVAEIDDPLGKGFLETFTVPATAAHGG